MTVRARRELPALRAWSRARAAQRAWVAIEARAVAVVTTTCEQGVRLYSAQVYGVTVGKGEMSGAPASFRDGRLAQLYGC